MSRGSANDRELTGEPGELLTVEQAANYLGFESRTIGRWGQNGRLARVRVAPNIVRFRRADLDEFVRLHTQRAEDGHP